LRVQLLLGAAAGHGDATSATIAFADRGAIDPLGVRQLLGLVSCTSTRLVTGNRACASRSRDRASIR
jgi:hypothetical protein